MQKGDAARGGAQAQSLGVLNSGHRRMSAGAERRLRPRTQSGGARTRRREGAGASERACFSCAISARRLAWLLMLIIAWNTPPCSAPRSGQRSP